MASNVQYHFENGIGYGKLPDGTTFVFDEECFDKVRPVKWYISLQGGTNPRPYLIDRSGRKMHTYLMVWGIARKRGNRGTYLVKRAITRWCDAYGLCHK